MSSAIDEAIACLKRHDRDHRQTYEKSKDGIMRFLNDLGVVEVVCTEDKNFAGMDPRTDLYLKSKSGHVLIEAKLCISSGGSIGRQFLSKVVKTIEKLIQLGKINPRSAIVNVIVMIPSSDSISIEEMCRRLAKVIQKEVEGVEYLKLEGKGGRCVIPLEVSNNFDGVLAQTLVWHDDKGNKLTINVFVSRIQLQ